MPWLLNLAYLLVLAAAAPWLLWQRVVQGKSRRGLWQKFTGDLPPRDDQRPLAWFHAVSVGEVLQLEPVIAGCRDRWPTLDILITTTTDTGYRLATERFAEDQVCWFPLDFSWSVKRALKRIRPNLVVLVELELWPNFILAVHRAGIPLALINGRISKNSFQGYRRAAWLFRRLLRCFDRLIMQNEVYADRIRALGGPAERTRVSGSIKYDRIQTSPDNPETLALARILDIAPRDPVFVAGSTQDPEERLAIEAWVAARQTHPNLRLVLVPRHPERFDAVAAMVRQMGHPLLRRSDTDRVSTAAGDRPVVLLDTIGELSACWGLADVAFVGGSLTNRGGQNMIEPAAYGAAVLFGPHTHNFQDVVEELLRRGGARVVVDGPSLVERLGWLLDQPLVASSLGEAARSFVTSRQGATVRTLVMIEDLLPAAIVQAARNDQANADAA